MKRACVIGWPIAHSRSPLIHGYWLKQLGIDGGYTKVPVEPEKLAAFIADLEANGFSGCNVTIPHKEAVFPLVHIADDNTARIGTVNTIYRRDGTTLGTNTDGEGFMASLKAGAPTLALTNRKAVMLGAGGSALAVTGALLETGVSEIAMVNRSVERAEALRRRFGPAVKPTPWEQRHAVLSETSLLVNTTSLGMSGQPPLDINLSALPQPAVVTDIVYIPLRTPLLDAAAARGHVTVPGLGMLLHQAVRGFSLWFSQTPDVTDELHDLIARDIDPGYGR